MDSEKEDSIEHCVFENNLESPTTQDEIKFSNGQGQMPLQGQSQGQMVYENYFDDTDQTAEETRTYVDQMAQCTTREIQEISESRLDVGRTSIHSTREREQRLLRLRKPRQDDNNPNARLRQFFMEATSQDNERNVDSVGHDFRSPGGVRFEDDSRVMDSSRDLVEGGEMQNGTAARSSQVTVFPHSQPEPNNFRFGGGDTNRVGCLGHAPEQGQLVVHQAMMGGVERTECGVVSQTFTRYAETQTGGYFMSQAHTQTIMSREVSIEGEGYNSDPSKIPEGFGMREEGGSYMPQFQNHTLLGGQEGTDHLTQVQRQIKMAELSEGEGQPQEPISSLMSSQGGLDDKYDSFRDQLHQLLGYEAIRARNNKSRRSSGMCTVIILDTSSCMAGEPISEAGQFISDFLDGLEETQFEYGLDENVAVICSGGEIHVLQHLTTDYEAVRKAVDTVYVEGNSQLQFAILLPLSVLISNPQQGIDYIGKIQDHRISPRIIIITDGHPSARLDIPGQENPVVEERDAVMFQTLCIDLLIHMRERTLCDVYCVPVGSADRKFLSALAACGGGCLLETTDARKLSRVFQHHYVVGNYLQADSDKSDRDMVAAVVQSALNCSDEHDVLSVIEILARGEPDLEDRDRHIAEEKQKAEQGFSSEGISFEGRGLERTDIKEAKGYMGGEEDQKSFEKVVKDKIRPEISGKTGTEQTHQDSVHTSTDKCMSKSSTMEVSTSNIDLQKLGFGLVHEDDSEENEDLNGLRTVKPDHGLNNKFGLMDLGPSPDESQASLNVRRGRAASVRKGTLDGTGHERTGIKETEAQTISYLNGRSGHRSIEQAGMGKKTPEISGMTATSENDLQKLGLGLVAGMGRRTPELSGTTATSKNDLQKLGLGLFAGMGRRTPEISGTTATSENDLQKLGLGLVHKDESEEDEDLNRVRTVKPDYGLNRFGLMDLGPSPDESQASSRGGQTASLHKALQQILQQRKLRNSHQSSLSTSTNR